MEHPHILDQWLRWAIREGHRLLHQQVAGSVSGIQYVWKYVGIPQVYTQVKQTVPINAGYIPHILKPFCWGFPSCHPALGCLRQGSFQWNEPCCTAPAGIPGWCGEVTPSHMGTVYGTIGLITTLLILLVFAWQKNNWLVVSNVCKSISHLLPGNVHDIHPHLSHLTKPTLTKQLSTWNWSLWSQRRRARETAAKLPIHIQELEVWLLAYHAWWFWCWNCSLMGRKMEENHLDFWKVNFISWYLCIWFLVLKFGSQQVFLLCLVLILLDKVLGVIPKPWLQGMRTCYVRPLGPKAFEAFEVQVSHRRSSKMAFGG